MFSQPLSVDSGRLPISLLLALLVVAFSVVRISADDELGSDGQSVAADPEVRVAFDELLAAEHWRERSAASKKLVELGRRAFPTLLQGTTHENDEVREYCYLALWDNYPTDPQAIEAFIRGLTDAGDSSHAARIRYSCAFRLGSHKIAIATDALREVYKGNRDLRLIAAKSLAELGQSDVITTLYDHLGSDHYMARYPANLGIKALTGKDLDDFADYDWTEGAFVSGGVEAKIIGRYVRTALIKSKRFRALAEFHTWLIDERPQLAALLAPQEEDEVELEITADRPTSRPAAEESNIEHQDKVSIHVRSRKFEEGDDITIESLVALKSVRGEGQYEVRGRYRLASKDEAHLAQWCSGGEVRGNKSIKVTKGEGEFRLTFSIIKKGSLHLSYYPIRGDSFGSLYYDLADGGVQATSQPQHAAVEWKTEETKFFSLYYAEAFRNDAKRVREYLESCVKNLGVEFGDERVSRLLEPISIDVYVHPHSTDKAQEGLATLNTGARHAELHILSPSVHRRGSQTSVGEPMDENYIFKTLVHEYSTIVLEQMTRDKPRGWRFFDAPSWFVQGYEEYLALTLSSEHSRSVTFQKYRDLHRAEPDRVTPEFKVKNDYIDGAVLLWFLHETFGKEKVHAILLSDADDFWSTLTQVLDRDRTQLHGVWREWLAAQ